MRGEVCEAWTCCSIIGVRLATILRWRRGMPSECDPFWCKILQASLGMRIRFVQSAANIGLFISGSCLGVSLNHGVCMHWLMNNSWNCFGLPGIDVFWLRWASLERPLPPIEESNLQISGQHRCIDLGSWQNPRSLNPEKKIILGIVHFHLR